MPYRMLNFVFDGGKSICVLLWDTAAPVPISKNSNKDFMAFFTSGSFNTLASMDWFKPIADKYNESFFKQKLDEGSHKKAVKNMMMEVASLMKRDMAKIKLDAMNPILQPEAAKQIQIRKAMIDTLETAVKKDTVSRFIFDDISQKKR